MTKICWFVVCLLPTLIVAQGGNYGNLKPKDVDAWPSTMPKAAYQQQRDTPSRRSNGGYGAPANIPSDVPASYGAGRPIETIDFNCVDLTDGNYPDPKDRCNTYYYVCSGYRASKIDCPKGLYFDPDNDVCEEKLHVPACGGQKPTTMFIPLDNAMDTYSLFDCSDKENGYYVNPADKCSPIYYSCSAGRSKQLQCQVGLDLVFDPDTLACELKDTTYVCTGTRSTRAMTYGSIFTTPNYPMDCKGKEEGLYPDPLAKCSHTFYVCSGESISMSTCAGNTFFDSRSQRCDIWLNVFACSGMETPPQDETLAPYNVKIVDFDCSSLKSGSYPDPKSKCSNLYYVCTNGIPYEMHCPTTLYWDPDESFCTHYDDIFACTGTTKAITYPTTATPFVPAEARIPEFDCSDKEDGFFVDPTNKCSTFYFVCSNKHDYKLHCADGLYFDLETTLCETWSHVFACSGKRLESTYPTIQPTVVIEKVPIDCKTLTDGDYADPENKCSHVYYSCSGGRGSKRLCAGSSTYFDPELRLCEIFDNVPVCSGHERPITTPFVPSDVPILPFDCSRLHNGLYSAGDCETFYWSCIGGVTHKTECPFGLKYDIETQKCDLKSYIPKCGGQRPTPGLTPYETTEPTYPINCHQFADGAYSDPTNVCSHSYYVCLSGRTIKMDCPLYLYFDVDNNRCDIKKRIVACGGSPINDVPTSYQQPQPSSYQQKRTWYDQFYNTVKDVPKPQPRETAYQKISNDDTTPKTVKATGYQQKDLVGRDMTNISIKKTIPAAATYQQAAHVPAAAYQPAGGNY